MMIQVALQDAGATYVEPSLVQAPASENSTTHQPIDNTGELKLASITIEGKQRVRSSQILAILAQEGIRPGMHVPSPEDPRIRRARERLIMTGWFAKVTLQLRLAEERDSQSPNQQTSWQNKAQARLIVRVEERSTLTVEHIYLGNSKLTAFRGGLELMDRNVFGRGIHMGGGFILGTRPSMERGRNQQGYRVSIHVPLGKILRTPTAFEAELKWLVASEPLRVAGHESDAAPRNFRAINYDRAGGRLGLAFAPLSDLRVTLGWRMEAVWTPSWQRASDEPGARKQLLEQQGLWPQLHRLSILRIGVEFDRKQYNVGQGIRVRGEVDMSTPAILSSYQYIRVGGELAYGFRLPWRHYFTPSVGGGLIAGQAPRFERFFAGDLSPWTPGREFGMIFSTRGPVDVFGTRINQREFGNAFGRVDFEYSWPLFRNTKLRRIRGGDLFWNVGLFTLADVMSSSDNTSKANDVAMVPLGFSANAGVRLDTALGVVEISLGNLLRRVPL